MEFFTDKQIDSFYGEYERPTLKFGRRVWFDTDEYEDEEEQEDDNEG